ncbi:hypothetical protein KBZ07_06450 [Cyanobium sp. BA20m-14]|uniref:hypothetical protein n=1 Tax=Cyanobium sp. BA20m-14 TaxID=2823703 RepID=UPI0020CEB1F3|nr:hypothetical protein [Cyanobium sp. BA20m-14]MCP9913046.1 hypothetical protein [Cyanobium sp. BA20m-14]
MTHHTNVRYGGRGKSPQLPAFCRTRQRSATTVGLSALQQLQWLLWLLLALQLSTILLLLSGTVPAPRRPQAGAPIATTAAAGATVLSPSQP